MYFKNITVRAQGPVVGKKNSLNMKSMPQTVFTLQLTVLHRDQLLPLQSKTRPQRECLLNLLDLLALLSFPFFSFPPCFSIVISSLSGFGFLYGLLLGVVPWKEPPGLAEGALLAFPSFLGKLG